MRISDEFRYFISIIKKIWKRKIATIMTISLLSFLCLVFLIIGINVNSTVKKNYNSAFYNKSIGITYYNQGISISKNNYYILLDELASTNVKSVEVNSDIQFICPSFDSNYKEVFTSNNEIILPIDKSEEYNQGDIYSVIINGESYEFIIAAFDDIEEPISNIEFLYEKGINVNYININISYNKNLSNAINCYDKLVKRFGDDWIDSYDISFYKAGTQKGLTILIVFVLSSFIIFITTIGIIVNSNSADMDNVSETFLILIMNGIRKKNIRRIFGYNIFFDTTIAMLISMLIYFIFRVFINSIIKFISLKSIDESLKAYDITDLKIVYNINFYLPILLIIIFSTFIFLLSFKNINKLYKNTPSEVLKEMRQ